MPEERAETVSVELPEHVVEAVESRLPYTQYESVEEYVAVALEALLREVADPTEDAPDGRPAAEDVDVDAEALEERLNSLGYL
ncbi:hypothetical protein [Halorubellus sp. PRR65]|uniref:hypothetical protein n=1 Tax=Halorubellus sp. PRR65 TaxID=3098148 RepID=UPI002B25CBAE|nr:hypothetical protein [Halorubellus sp. PRR65]